MITYDKQLTISSGNIWLILQVNMTFESKFSLAKAKKLESKKATIVRISQKVQQVRQLK